MPNTWSFTKRGFNEAGGFLPRKPGRIAGKGFVDLASMRPGDFSPGNCAQVFGANAGASRASMRPGDFSPGNPSVMPVETLLEAWNKMLQ